MRASIAGGGFFKGTEILIGGPVFFKATFPSSGGTDAVEFPIPCDVSLNGAVARSQAFILGGAGIEFCNAVDLTAGFYWR